MTNSYIANTYAPHEDDDKIIVGADIDVVDTLREDHEMSAKAAIAENYLPASVIEFFTDGDPAVIDGLLFNNGTKINVAIDEDGTGVLTNQFADGVHKDLGDYLTRAAERIASATYNPKTGDTARNVQVRIVENASDTLTPHASRMHVDRPTTGHRELHAHIGVSKDFTNSSGEAERSQLEIVTLGRGENEMTRQDLHSLMGYRGPVADHDVLKDHTMTTKTGDLTTFWGVKPIDGDAMFDTIKHRTAHAQHNEQDNRRYSILFRAVRPNSPDEQSMHDVLDNMIG